MEEVSPESVTRGRRGDVAGRIRPTPAVPIHEAIAEWVAWMELRELSRAQVLNSKRLAAKAARDRGWRVLDDITAGEVIAFLEQLQRGGAEAKTRNEYRSAISRLFDFAAAPPRSWVGGANPAKAAPRAKVVRRQVRVVPSVDDVRRLIEAARRDWRKRDRWVVYLTAASTGLRWRTLKLLERDACRLDEDPPYIDVPATLLKNGEPQIVWLTAELAEVLREHLTTRYRFEPRVRVPEGRLFVAVPKTTSFDRDLKAAKLEKKGGAGKTLSFHSLRHFSSNRMAWVGFAPGERQAQNGHKTLAMTEKIYTDPSHAELGRKVLQMPGLLAEAPTGSPPARGGGRGESAGEALTRPPASAHHDPVTMAPPMSDLDLEDAARAGEAIVTDQSSVRAAPSGPRYRAEGTVRQSGRLDSNRAPSAFGRSGFDPAADVARGLPPGRTAPRDPVTLAIEIAEAQLRIAEEQLRIARLLRQAEGAHRGTGESGSEGGQPAR